MAKILLAVIIVFYLTRAVAQNVGIGAAIPNTNAALDITSTNKGLLLSTLAGTNAITGAKPAGLLIYNNADNQIYFYNGSYWQISATQAAAPRQEKQPTEESSLTGCNCLPGIFYYPYLLINK